MTEGALNASTNITDKLRIGAQIFDHDYGNLGQGHPQLDWAAADYRFKPWLGFRGGKVKTTFGLYNDTQDMNFLHTWALLPQGIYPEDLRDSLLAHEGGDVYGTIPLKQAGKVSYTAFIGRRQDGLYGGYIYLLEASGINYTNYGGRQMGVDLRWKLPLKGATVGYSGMNENITGTGTWNGAPTIEKSKKDQWNQFYGQYTIWKLRFDSEYRRYWRDQIIFSGMGEVGTDVRPWYVSGAYRISSRVEVGSYYSRNSISYWDSMPAFGMFLTSPPQSSPAGHVNDKAVTLHLNLKRYWDVKVEGHFIDGYGSSMYPFGFYAQDNPHGLQPTTNGVVVRTGMYF
jgi:hypothetical protein